ncbi:MAG: prolyl oligopeptidase family serine peptidase [candidate division WOR-3 bacterium]|jgi:dipeptidyl aminopeptidase/acylaminoacyl peptidase
MRRYGTWYSPITAEIVAKKSIRFGDLQVDGDCLYWVESRPAEKGRSVIVQHRSDSEPRDILQPPFSARSRVHEYGGGAFTVSKGTVYFVNFEDQCIYAKEPAGQPYPLTHEDGNRYADLNIDEVRNRIVCIQEAHGENEPVNSLVSMDIKEETIPQRLVAGSDFYSSPRLSPDGKQLAWLTWNHPNMPWDGTELWVAEMDETGNLRDPRKVAGGVSESVFQPEWSPDGVLYFVSDRSGWWNIYRCVGNELESVVRSAAEFGMPQWVFGLSTYGFISKERIACAFNHKGYWHLATIDTDSRTMCETDTPFNDITHLKTANEWVFFYGASSTEDLSVMKHNTSTGETHLIQRSGEAMVDPVYISEPELVEFDTTDSRKAYGFFYRPRNKDFSAPPDERPPLIVVTHGGPTSCSYPSLDLKIQYWTSRGFAVLDVNYGGSTGFGRPYRERLKGNWGVVDVDDCVNGAKYLVEKDLVDGNRLVIKGGSAGGYTTLAALTFRDVFKAGASYYGVSDLEALIKETHKFESRYADSLVGPYPEAANVYAERSPIHYTERLTAPIIFFQGLDDKVVPPNQAEKMVQALRDRSIPVAYIAFEGEQHGFRKAENIARCLEAELYFYSRIFGFEVEGISPVQIENL